MHLQCKMLGVVLLVICQSPLSTTKRITLRSTMPENMEMLRLEVENVFGEMASYLDAASASVSMEHKQNGTHKQVIQFSDVMIVNWLADIFINYLTYFNTVDTKYSEENKELEEYFPYIRFKVNETVVVVNFTIPQLLFTGNYILKQDDNPERIHCAMNNLSVGLFMHFSRFDNSVYVDNFQMAPPETSVISMTNNETNNDEKLKSELAVWLSTYEIVENYLKHFHIIDGELQ